MCYQKIGLKIYYYKIIVPSLKIGKLLTYKSSNSKIVGCRVLILVRNSLQIGLVYSSSINKTELKAKEIISVIDSFPLISNELLRFIDWISNYYLTSKVQVLKNIISLDYFTLKNLQVELTQKYYTLSNKRLIILDSKYNFTDEDERVLGLFNRKKTFLNDKQFKSISISSKLGKYLQAGLVKLSFLIEDSSLKKKSFFFKLNLECLKKGSNNYKNLISKRESALLRFFVLYIQSDFAQDWCQYKDLSLNFNVSRITIKKLVERKLLEKKERVVKRIPKILKENSIYENITPSTEQEEVISQVKLQINKNIFQTNLLFGVTGSGKTLVYQYCVKYAIEKGKKVLILLPEILLTSQLIRIFNGMFPKQVAVVHSALSKGEKIDVWEDILTDKYNIVIGVRSSIFVPLKNIGLIIVDEEHESSYKQTEREPCYNSRDLAVYRAMLNNAVCILGSATPSLESFLNAKNGKYNLFRLTKRVKGAFLPKIMISPIFSSSSHYFSDISLKKIDETLDKGNKIIVFLNRRGFASYLLCNKCKHIPTCKHCSVSLTYHQYNKQLICHHCGYREKSLDFCPVCGEQILEMKGIGTEKIVSEIEKLYPNRAILRMDYDTTRTKNSHDKLLSEFKTGKYDFIVGTQMITKGLNLPQVELVIVINSLQESLIPDYHSDERNFQILCQVAGRAGRNSSDGLAILQSHEEESPLLSYVVNNDYESFFSNEYNNRKLTFFPPVGRMVKVSFSGLNYHELRKKTYDVYFSLNKSLEKEKEVNLLPPIEGLIARVKAYYRMMIIIRINNKNYNFNKRIKDMIRLNFENNSTLLENIKVIIDIDPLSTF